MTSLAYCFRGKWRTNASQGIISIQSIVSRLSQRPSGTFNAKRASKDRKPSLKRMMWIFGVFLGVKSRFLSGISPRASR